MHPKDYDFSYCGKCIIVLSSWRLHQMAASMRCILAKDHHSCQSAPFWGIANSSEDTFIDDQYYYCWPPQLPTISWMAKPSITFYQHGICTRIEPALRHSIEYFLFKFPQETFKNGGRHHHRILLIMYNISRIDNYYLKFNGHTHVKDSRFENT